MHHKATVKLGTHDNLNYNIQCSCGTGGDFGSKEEAMNWMTTNHFRYLQGINTAEFVDATPQPVAATQSGNGGDKGGATAAPADAKPRKQRKPKEEAVQ